ncbi:WD40-repeat-containing domain protein [Lipomyces oligophaga]|uniref:WD40-repeat-containing domain protein n=1 Tax=Lipomyces oligophaga TaxID=45792 RepID=UPI0034CD83F2
MAIPRLQQNPPSSLATVQSASVSTTSSTSSSALASFIPEPPTPAPSPTPYSSIFFYPNGSSSHSQHAEQLHSPPSDSFEDHRRHHDSLASASVLPSLVREFACLDLQQRQTLLATILSSCDTSTLSFVADFVSPLLKVDPFRVLPNEICLRILSYIDDPKTLARASQVSKHWALILSDDVTWRSLCDSLITSKQWHKPETIAPYSSSSISSSFSQSLANRFAFVADTSRLAAQVSSQTTVSVSSPPMSAQPLTDITLSSTVSAPEQSMMQSTYTSLLSRPQVPRSYRSFIKQRYLVESAWLNGGHLAARHVTTDQGVVTCLNLTDKYIIVALDNARIHVFAHDGKLLHTLAGHMMGVWAIQPWGDTLVSGGCDREVRVWDLVTGAPIRVMHGHTSTVRCLKMSDERTAISGSRDASLRIWDIETGECKHTLLGHQASVRCLEVHGDLCVSGSYDTTAKIWSISRGVLLHTLTGHFSQIYALAFDGVRIATGSLDTTVSIWSPETGQRLALLQGHTSLVGQMQLSGDTLVTGSSDGSARVWDLKRMACVHRLAAHDNSVTTLQFDNRRIVTGGSDGSVKIWDIKTGHHIRDLSSTFEAVWRVAFQDEKLVVLATKENRTHMEVVSFLPPEDDFEEICE